MKIYTEIKEREIDKDLEIFAPIEIKIHPLNSNTIVINYPGFQGSIDGYNNKYLKIGGMVIVRRIGAYVQLGNTMWEGLSYSQSVVDDLSFIIEVVIQNSINICGSINPDIYLMGFSSGGSAVAAICSKFPQVKKILLIAPSFDAGEIAIMEGLGKFTGEVYIANGDKDEVIPYLVGHLYEQFSKKTAFKVKWSVIPNCDHYFKGSANGLILSQAVLWAFNDYLDFPYGDEGVNLY